MRLSRPASSLVRFFPFCAVKTYGFNSGFALVGGVGGGGGGGDDDDDDDVANSSYRG